MATKPVLILEGPGDGEAVPELLRRLSDFQVFPVSKPIKNQSVGKLAPAGELERFVNYALGREGDSVLILVDADEHCAKDIAERWSKRIAALKPSKKVGLGLFVREYESLFLACIDLIAKRYPNYGWHLDEWSMDQNHETPRGVKERLSGMMRKGKGYKATMDQAKFTSIIDFKRLNEKCRSFQHLESLLQWLLDNGNQHGRNLVYPRVIG